MGRAGTGRHKRAGGDGEGDDDRPKDPEGEAPGVRPLSGLPPEPRTSSPRMMCETVAVRKWARDSAEFEMAVLLPERAERRRRGPCVAASRNVSPIFVARAPRCRGSGPHAARDAEGVAEHYVEAARASTARYRE